MKQLVLILSVVCVIVGCGKKPSALLVPSVTENPNQVYPQAYPKPQAPPPAQ
jgi:hypothetical protein